MAHEQFKDYRIVCQGKTVAYTYHPHDDVGAKLRLTIHVCINDALVYGAPAAVVTMTGDVVVWHTENYADQMELF